MSTRTLWLVKDNDDVVSWCRCSPSIVGLLGQKECPWCGCGWLFTCSTCSKSFAFARVAWIDESIESVAARTYRKSFGIEETPEELQETVECLESMMIGLELGDQVVVIDGTTIKTNTEGPIEFDGWMSRHKLKWLPQVRALEDPSCLKRTLLSKSYWNSRRHPE
jgi:hypothetical protein